MALTVLSLALRGNDLVAVAWTKRKGRS